MSACAWCGSADHLTHHHVDPASKVANVCDLSGEEREAEVQKCILLCWDCHKRHHQKHPVSNRGVPRPRRRRTPTPDPWDHVRQFLLDILPRA